MRKLGCSLLGVSILCLVPSAMRAQDATPPRVLTITREFVKPYRTGEVHGKAESAFVQAMRDAKWPTHYVGMTSLSGKSRALFFTFNATRYGEFYEAYYEAKRQRYDDPAFHVATPTEHAASAVVS